MALWPANNQHVFVGLYMNSYMYTNQQSIRKKPIMDNTDACIT